jgi:hypothetical protein
MDSLPITDMMGNTTVTVTGSAPLVAGKVGTSAINLVNAMNGANATNYISGTWTGSANYTVSFWFRIPAYSSTQQTIFSAYGGANIICINPTTNTLSIYIPSGGGLITTNFATTSFAISLNTWYNVVAIFQTGGLCSFYVNNALINSTTNSGGLGIYTTTSFRFGTYDTSLSNSFSGYIDDFRLYNFAAPNVVPPYIYLPLDGSLVDAMGNTTVTTTGSPGYVNGVVGTQALSLVNTASGTATRLKVGYIGWQSDFSTVYGRVAIGVLRSGSSNYVSIGGSNASQTARQESLIPHDSGIAAGSGTTTSLPWLHATSIALQRIVSLGQDVTPSTAFYISDVLIGPSDQVAIGWYENGGGSRAAIIDYCFVGITES